MHLQDKAVQTLTFLGLTSCQARVYLTLVQIGLSTAKSISKSSGVARQDIYKINTDLKKLGLVEKILTKPISFRAVPIEDGFSILLEGRLRKTSELQETAKTLIPSIVNKEKLAFQKEEPQFSVICGKDALILCALRAIKKAKKSIDYISSSKNFFPWIIAQEKLYKRALGRGVKIRLIIDQPEGKSLPNILQASKKDSCIQVKYVPTVPKFRMGLYDKKDLYINTQPMTSLKSCDVLRINNPSFTEVIQEHFETNWKKAIPYPSHY